MSNSKDRFLKSGRQIPSLDGFRAVAIMLVFWGHSVHYESDDWTGLLSRPITRTGSLKAARDHPWRAACRGSTNIVMEL